MVHKLEYFLGVCCISLPEFFAPCLLFSRYLSASLTHTHAFSLSLDFSIFLSLDFSLSLALSPSFFSSLPLSLPLSLSLSLSLPLSLPLSLSPSLSLSLCLSIYLSLCLSLSLSLLLLLFPSRSLSLFLFRCHLSLLSSQSLVHLPFQFMFCDRAKRWNCLGISARVSWLQREMISLDN